MMNVKERAIFSKEAETLRPEGTGTYTEAMVPAQHGPVQQASQDLSVRAARRKSLRSDQRLSEARALMLISLCGEPRHRGDDPAGWLFPLWLASYPGQGFLNYLEQEKAT